MSAQQQGVKKVLVTGSSGYVGNYLLKAIAKKYPAVECIGMSRSGVARKGEQTTNSLENVSYLAADCLKPSSFENAIADVDSVVHCVGALFESGSLTYEVMNRDTCVNIASELNRYAKESDSKRNFVMISSAKAPFFAPRYLSSKEEAEKYLREECDNLRSTVIKPGVVLNTEHRWWGVPVGAGNDLAWFIDAKLCKPLLPKALTDATDFLIPARSTQLTTIEYYTMKGVMGENEGDYSVIGPTEYTAFEHMHK